jgi:transposase
MRFILTHNERENIKQLHRKCRIRRHADKLKALLMLDKGFSCIEVGELLLLDDDTIRKYREQYINIGVNSLLSDNNKGTTAKLNNAQCKELSSYLEENTYSNTKGIIAWIEKNFKITYTINGINSLLKRLGFVYKKPVLTPCKSDVKKQEEFIAQYRELKKNLSQNDQIYFMDGVHPQHNSVASYGWIKRGQTKQLKTNNGRKRMNINGLLNIEKQELLYVEDERINSQTVIASLNKVLEKQKKGFIHIVLDNAKYYHAHVVKDFLLENPRIKLHFLPPYSPNLNIIERLWHILKINVVYNKFYLKFSDFNKAIKYFLNENVWHREEYINYLTDNFQIIKPNFSGSYLV